jgi:heat shock protein HspQ
MIRINESFHGEDPVENLPKFQPGQLVKHKKYGYRGVIVSVDRHCKADPDWYMSNQSQPERKQPWYHVLVDDSATVTYPAEENLMEDDSNLPVNHLLLEVFFRSFEAGVYLRNETPWME